MSDCELLREGLFVCLFDCLTQSQSATVFHLYDFLSFLYCQHFSDLYPRHNSTDLTIIMLWESSTLFICVLSENTNTTAYRCSISLEIGWQSHMYNHECLHILVYHYCPLLKPTLQGAHFLNTSRKSPAKIMSLLTDDPCNFCFYTMIITNPWTAHDYGWIWG